MRNVLPGGMAEIMSKKITKILIANRAEIAVRIINTCRKMGIETVSIFTEKERDYPHSKVSDQAVCLGEGSLAETYLNQKKLIEICKQTGAQAIHPGYGFLSENSEFALAVEQAGLIFIGPKSDAIILMGDKEASKKSMEKAGVPVVPGYHGEDQGAVQLKKHADKIGYPLLIKAVAGGGGKGMRLIEREQDFEAGLERAKSEAKKAFGNDRVLLEKYITRPRHIEVQVFSDSHGNHLHFFERECSIQRRHQKIIEESPSPALDDKLRAQITEAAVKVASSVNYLGAGTVEFIFAESGEFYFLEMNTRLQVEHPISEIVTGVDLVRLQILVAQGEALPFQQSEIKQRGWAMEARIYAEDPDNNFLPTVGTLEHVKVPAAPGMRFDLGYDEGNVIGVDFDPMLAKVIGFGENREYARLNLMRALEESGFLGLVTNKSYLLRLLKLDNFIKGETQTDFVEKNADGLKVETQDNLSYYIAAALLAKSSSSSSLQSSGERDTSKGPWELLTDFRNL